MSSQVKEEGGGQGKCSDENSRQMLKNKKNRTFIQTCLDIFLVFMFIWLSIAYIRTRQTIKQVKVEKTVMKKPNITKPSDLPDPPPSPITHNKIQPPSPDHFNNMENFIFVGGMPGAGTSLMRAILDAHPDVRCSEGRDSMGKLMHTWRDVAYNKGLLERMRLGGVSEKVIDIATALFLFELIPKIGPPAPRLCLRDPLSMMGGRYLLHILPNVKVIFLIRDIRAATHSVVKRKKTINNKKMKNFEEATMMLSQLTGTMRAECAMLGVDRCLPVRYEDLVLYPRETIETILKFLDLKWRDEVMHHHHYANKTGAYSDPRSNDTVPIYTSSLTSWVNNIPRYITDFPSYWLRQLEVTGYDPLSFPPDYSKLPPHNWTEPKPMTTSQNHIGSVLNFKITMAKISEKSSDI